tara:strand:- start:167 stop:337 length:171 start_codon:yes stop_codon:yes gene_type:complete
VTPPRQTDEGTGPPSDLDPGSFADPNCLRDCLHVLSTAEEKQRLIEALSKLHQGDA